MDAARLAIGPAIVYLIAAEMLFSDIGFGYRIRYDAKTGMTVVFPYLVILAIFGFTMDFSLRWLQRKTCPWFVPEESR
jgi:NitT/TauT family transport system permease protein